jgi:3-oxoacyl-[acyl-carrier-protein] synthase III
LAGQPDKVALFKTSGHERFTRSNKSLSELAIASAQKTLAAAELDAGGIDAVVIGTSEFDSWCDKSFPEMLSVEILLALGIRETIVVGATMAGCANYANSLRVARNMIVAEGCRNVLVIETNKVKWEEHRAVISPATGAGNMIFADGAASFIVSPGRGDFMVAGMRQVVKPIDKRTAQFNDVILNNVEGYRIVVGDSLAQAGLTREGLAKVFSSNVNKGILVGFAATLQVPPEMLFMENVSRTGHVWSADNLIGVVDFCALGAPADAAFLLLCQGESYYSAVVLRRH